ncbi:---NA--- [Octopus vulgaris]|uniref:---NA n=1 Tax=Octopus vulgaris TaxID=6645 RepID=A0AA36BY23_OCTVU|nr:---NA--- [Octopus vulgaris]
MAVGGGGSRIGLDCGGVCVHKRTNLEQKPYNCNICGKSFYERRNFTTHTRVHGGEKPYHCDIIGESFSVSSCLTRPKHTQTLEKTSFR